jgi:hypothetical protein
MECDIVPEEKPPGAVIRIVPGLRKLGEEFKTTVKFNKRIKDIEIDS